MCEALNPTTITAECIHVDSDASDDDEDTSAYTRRTPLMTILNGKKKNRKTTKDTTERKRLAYVDPDLLEEVLALKRMRENKPES